MVSVCLPSDALSKCLPSYLHFSYLGRGVSLGWPYTAWLSLIELDKAVVHVIKLAEKLHYSLHFFSVDLDYLTAFKLYILFDPISLLTRIYSTDILI